MNETERMRILAEARAALERTAHINAAEGSEYVVDEDRLEAWRRGRPQHEPKSKREHLDTARTDWSSIVDQRIAAMRDFLVTVVGEALRESFSLERGAYSDALKQRDTAISTLECALAKQAALIAKIELRVIENEIADHERKRSVDDGNRTIDLPAWPRKNVN
jgi:hypothetical protein